VSQGEGPFCEVQPRAAKTNAGIHQNNKMEKRKKKKNRKKSFFSFIYVTIIVLK